MFCDAARSAPNSVEYQSLHYCRKQVGAGHCAHPRWARPDGAAACLATGMQILVFEHMLIHQTAASQVRHCRAHLPALLARGLMTRRWRPMGQERGREEACALFAGCLVHERMYLDAPTCRSMPNLRRHSSKRRQGRVAAFGAAATRRHVIASHHAQA